MSSGLNHMESLPSSGQWSHDMNGSVQFYDTWGEWGGQHRSLYVVSRYRYFMKDIDTQSIPELIDSPITTESGDCD